MGRARMVVTAVALIVVLAGQGRAQAVDEKERKAQSVALIKEGRARYDLGKFDEAIKLFEQAYEVWPYPEALYNLGQAWRQVGDAKKALFYYKSYLRNQPNAKNRAEVELRIEELEKIVASQEASKGKPPEGTEEPGRGLPGGGAAAASEPVAPVAMVPPPGSGDRPHAWYDDTLGWVVAGTGLVAVGAGSYLLVDAGRLEDEALVADEGEAQALYDKAQDRKTAGAIVLAGGGALVVAGVVKLWLIDTPKNAGAGAVPSSVSVGPRWIQLGWRF